MSCGVAQETTLDRAVRRLRENDSSFTRLNLWNKRIGDEGVSVLADALRVNTSLKVLVLGGNSIGDEGVSVLADALRVNTSLEKLHLSGNSISDEGVSVLADALTVNTSLTKLDLWGNNFGDEGVSVLADALWVNTSLEALYLNGNSISDGGVSILADALRVNTSLEELGLADNSIGEEGVSVLADVLTVNTSLTKLDLWGNNFGDEGEVFESRVDELIEINRDAKSPHKAFGQKVELILDSEHDTIEDAMSLALTGLERFSESDERWDMLGAVLGWRKHGRDVAKALDLTTVLDMYRHASECGASPALVNLLRAQPSLCEHRDEEEQGGLYPFMLLATMPTAEVGDVFEVLLMKPDLVASAITMT
eukprot:CAMPEP_0197464702 /NCGR_PEP_ID=MMETSP1175-20131217/64157_1 /TAXON_ID=1003142 /ORGANISM="Triceratium dubium, Strain CCMP147" /LENGTH=365 /DNA_ID=CAMNT_0043000687 /DNA_START=135 /DNA_END=1232 /DNA_ORIENTATION=+